MQGKKKRDREFDDYAAFVRRSFAALCRRAVDADENEMAQLYLTFKEFEASVAISFGDWLAKSQDEPLGDKTRSWARVARLVGQSEAGLRQAWERRMSRIRNGRSGRGAGGPAAPPAGRS